MIEEWFYVIRGNIQLVISLLEFWYRDRYTGRGKGKMTFSPIFWSCRTGTEPKNIFGEKRTLGGAEKTLDEQRTVRAVRLKLYTSLRTSPGASE